MNLNLGNLVSRGDDNDKEKGRHLVAACDISEGRLLFCERPMVALQSTGNVHNGVLVCNYCFSFVGTPQAVLDVTSNPECLCDITTTTRSRQDADDDGGDKSSILIPCQNKCGQIYCSDECRQDDWYEGGHKELCTGCIGEQNAGGQDVNDHPLIKFKKHAMETNEIFILIATWIARIRRAGDNDTSEKRQRAYTDFCMEPWWDVCCNPLYKDPNGFSDAVILEKSLKSLCEESYSYLQNAWSNSDSNNNGDDSVYGGNNNNSSASSPSPWLTPIGISKLIGSIEQNCMGIQRKHAIRTSIMEDQNLRYLYHAQIIKCLERAGMIGDDEEEEATEEEEGKLEDDKQEEINKFSSIDKVAAEKKEGDNKHGESDGEMEREQQGEEKEEWDYSVDEIASFLAGLKSSTEESDEWDSLFLPMDGTAMYSTACKMNHSCEPNVILLYKTRGWGRKHPLVAYCVALRDIKKGEELTISYIPSEDDYHKRQEQLQNYGFTCMCNKCLREKDGIESGNQPEIDDGVDDLFGSDDEGDEEGEGADIDDDSDHDVEGDLDGEAMLHNAVKHCKRDLNGSRYATIPLPSLALVSTFVIQLANALISNESSLMGEDDVSVAIRTMLIKCTDGIQGRDFCLCTDIGSALEATLFDILQTKGSWPYVCYRQAFWCGALTASIGRAHEGSFLVAMELIDKAMILGLERNKSLKDFISYVELHSSQMAVTPCPPAIKCHLPDYTNPELVECVKDQGLLMPIQHPVNELAYSTVSDCQSMLSKLRYPSVIRKVALGWPATTKWRDLVWLVQHYGHRLVPIEVGSMLATQSPASMKEELMTFRQFITQYLLPSSKKECWSLDDAGGIHSPPSSSSTRQEPQSQSLAKIAYLAQHPLLHQMESLYDDVDTSPLGIEPTNVNIWMGTGGTRTPLHYDSYDNLLIQLVGAKYVRLYNYEEAPNLYLMNENDSAENNKKNTSSKKQNGGEENSDGVVNSSYGLQGNMSQVNCETEDYSMHPLAKNAKFQEVLLLPGDCLFIPSRQWHYVRSLSTSVSINYWF